MSEKNPYGFGDMRWGGKEGYAYSCLNCGHVVVWTGPDEPSYPCPICGSDGWQYVRKFL